MTQTGHAQQSGRAVRTGHRAGGSQHPAAIIDIGGLERGLRQAVAGEVRFDAASKAMYANDGSNFRQVPIGVVIPKTLDDIVAIHRVWPPGSTGGARCPRSRR